MAMVIYEVSDGIATLTLNNPQERNSMTADMVAEIVTAMDAAESDPNVRVVIVTGAAPAFCAGASAVNSHLIPEFFVCSPWPLRLSRLPH